MSIYTGTDRSRFHILVNHSENVKEENQLLPTLTTSAISGETWLTFTCKRTNCINTDCIIMAIVNFRTLDNI